MNIFCHTWSSPEVYITKTVRVYIDLFDDALKNPICTIRTTKPEWFSYALRRQWKIHSNEVVWVVWWEKGRGGVDKRGNVGSTGWGRAYNRKTSFTWRKCPLLLLIRPTQCNIKMVFASEESYNKKCIMLSDKIRGWSAHARICNHFLHRFLW